MDLERFLLAQQDAYPAALAELRAGRKQGHWMWFVLPQLRGLGRSPMAERFGISGVQEARAYAAHPVLGSRLRACAQALLALGTADPVAVLGEVDALKLRSSMTLFAHAVPQEPVFQQVLDRFYDGVADAVTERLLAAQE